MGRGCTQGSDEGLPLGKIITEREDLFELVDGDHQAGLAGVGHEGLGEPLRDLGVRQRRRRRDPGGRDLIEQAPHGMLTRRHQNLRPCVRPRNRPAGQHRQQARAQQRRLARSGGPHQDQWTALGQPCPHLDDQIGDHPLPAEEPPLTGGVEPGEARIGAPGRPGRIIDVPGRGRERGRRDGPSQEWSGRWEPGGRRLVRTAEDADGHRLGIDLGRGVHLAGLFGDRGEDARRVLRLTAAGWIDAGGAG